MIALWGWPSLAYAGYMLIVAILQPARRPWLVALACVGYGVAAAAAATVDSIVALTLLPGALALAGYWLSGLFVGMPQPGLEQWLLHSDGVVFDRLRLDRALRSAPLWLLELVELAYATVYIVIIAGAVAMAMAGREPLAYYWTVVLTSDFICYAALPFLRSRPPRSLEAAGIMARRAPVMRRVNEAVVNRGSIQVNTIPSGHVAGALAAGLAVASWSPVVGGSLILAATLIAIGATVGRYHYAVDCLLGAGVAVVVWCLV